MEERYVIACIRIPMKLFKDGKYELRNELANIQFEECNELPEKGNLEECNLNSVFDKFYINTDTLQDTLQSSLNIDNVNMDEPQNIQNSSVNDIKEEESSHIMYVLKTELQKKPKQYKNNTFKRVIKDTLKRFSRKNRE
jgi:hypothetical protein